PVREAALKGSGEIGFTILSMTLSLVAVFIPVLFMGGIVGRLLHEFAVTIAASILVSGLVSLTLTPMLCSRFLRPHDAARAAARPGRIAAALERGFDAMLGLYSRTLSLAMRGRRVAAFAGIGNPAAFRATLERLGGEVVDFRAFADHHAYDNRDAIMLADTAAAVQADIVATTLKDLVKMPRQRLGEIPLLAVEIAMQADRGAAEVTALIGATCGLHAGRSGDAPRAP
ncbi:MAG: hypothetical protein EBR23_13040, partial [Planctomycetia bacterium]|nr:hypothetical protein [Planctomycetia bacterium]